MTDHKKEIPIRKKIQRSIGFIITMDCRLFLKNINKGNWMALKACHYIFLLTIIFISCSEKKDLPPNFVIILVDDLGWADVKCNYPESFYETPHVDRLAERGIRFTQAYAAHPVCSPTRAALITGKHPNRVNITDWLPGNDPRDRPLLGPQDSDELALNELTLAEQLKSHGYQTGFVGKWHLGNDEEFWPEHQGFDLNIGGWEAGSPKIVKGKSNGYYSPYGNPRLKDGPEGEYLTDRLTDESIRFIREKRGHPFLLYLSYYAVHTPIQPAKKHFENYRTKREHLNLKEIPHKREGEGWTKLIQENSAYASMVASMDENVGRVLETLQEQGLDENTWVIFTSDNGGLSTLFRKNAPTSNGPLRAGKGWCYEGGIRVPFIISGPHIHGPGRVEEQPVVTMDVFATVLSLAGLTPPDNDGENLLPVIQGDGLLDRDVLFWHYPHYHGSAWTPGSAIRKGDWKLVVFYEDKRCELYNLKEDVGESTDVSRDFPEKVEELKALLNKKLMETNGQFPVINRDLE
jgi:arylsulfatase A-like enzyme